jgi:citrate lyase subunit beta / citryl-CoA lyase
MRESVRPRRSALYMPGANARAMEKARGLACDVVILDLEDAVAPAAKAEARRLVAAALAAGGFGRREVVVRVNGPQTPWGPDDLAMAEASACDAILLPKAESAPALRSAKPLWCMVETPLGVLRAEAIAAAEGVECLVMGTSDLTKDLRARHAADRLPMLASLSLCLLAARAHGRAILDGVHLDLADAQGFERACVQGRELGFDGKTLIHPSQIAAANAAFGPSAGEVEQARRVVGAFEQAEREGRGVAVLDGRLVENLHVAEARRTLALAEALETD